MPCIERAAPRTPCRCQFKHVPGCILLCVHSFSRVGQHIKLIDQPFRKEHLLAYVLVPTRLPRGFGRGVQNVPHIRMVLQNSPFEVEEYFEL